MEAVGRRSVGTPTWPIATFVFMVHLQITTITTYLIINKFGYICTHTYTIGFSLSFFYFLLLLLLLLLFYFLKLLLYFFKFIYLFILLFFLFFFFFFFFFSFLRNGIKGQKGYRIETLNHKPFQDCLVAFLMMYSR